MKLTLEKIAEYLQGEVRGDAQQIISAAVPFEIAGAGQITFAGGAKYLKKLADCPAGAIIVPKGAECPSKNLICVKNPQVAFIRVFELFILRRNHWHICKNPASVRMRESAEILPADKTR